jgi:hypothetical protein
MAHRRFPPPWSVEELDACFVVRDRNGQTLAYVYFEEEPAGDQPPSCSRVQKNRLVLAGRKTTRSKAQ